MKFNLSSRIYLITKKVRSFVWFFLRMYRSRESHSDQTSQPKPADEGFLFLDDKKIAT